ncbi:sugar O-acetyltransferase [Planctomicrobium sp. SH668]|uniref:sugar O-acetyltransferase n=1 Tax=Planctomicrobium sp. SH668 TaxID=3448126 RepID=UPI003F5C331E
MRTEREKMLTGELYHASDPELVQLHTDALNLLHTLNHARMDEAELKRETLCQLLGSGGDTVTIQPPFYCDYGKNIFLGKKVFFNFNCVVLDVCEVHIGDFTLFAPAVQIYAAAHPFDRELRREVEFGKPIFIGSDVWVGGGAIICPGVRIGSNTIIGAGSVVTRDIPDGVVAVGNPCRVLRDINDNDQTAIV